MTTEKTKEWIDALGRTWPADLVPEIDKARDDLVNELAAMAENMSRDLATMKQRFFDDVRSFVQLSGEKYGIKLGGLKGNLTLFTFDGQFKLQVAISERMQFGEQLQAAKALIDECIKEWSSGSKPEIQLLVQDAFQTDKEGKINTARVLALRRIEIKDERWVNAMTAIGDSLTVTGSKEYIRFYRRIGQDKYEPISLDFASV